ncbi:MAG: InlB B-repeat-containing protein, partial [Paludibacteraceae bacterium]|nr:InlB B-repeat-containing protein [Paludibacteraceae bacterium]
MTHDYQFYHLFSPTGVNTSNTNFVTWDASNLVLPATELTNHCYEGMFSALGNKVAKGPQIMALNPESNCASACFKNMFNGCTAMTELTTYFLTWGSGSGTETWLPANWSGTFKGTSDLAAEGSHTGANGTGNASITQSVSPNAYIFKVHDNLITWDGTCYVDKYATTAAPVIEDPYGDFDAWYTDKTAGSAVTLSSLAAPSGLIPLYARLASATNYNVAISAPTNGTITVTYNDGSSQSFTSDNRDIAENTNLTITATPASEDYILTGLTVTPDGDSPIDHTSGEIYRLESDITIAATFARAYTISANGVHGSVTNTGKYAVGSEVSLTAVPDEYYSFVRWSNGETDNPLEITVSEDLNLTAEFAFDYTPTSSAQSANIFQGATNDTTKILYVLASETVGGITYTPKDMGYGVAWSDKNVGASASTDAGSYFYWSGTTAVNKNDNSNRYIGVEGESEGYSLPPTKDPAQVNISSAWYMPTKAEWQDLIDNCTWTRVNAGTIQYDLNITNKTNNAITIYLPYTGYKTGNNDGAVYGPTAAPPTGRYACYWLNTLYSSSASGILFEYAYSFQTDGTNTNGAIIHSHLCYESMPVRPIYKPTFPTCKLTINVGSKSYVYVCELGQSITITAKPTVVGNGFLRWNEDGNTQATRTFVPQGDETYTAIFGELTTYAITFVDEDGLTILDGPKDVAEGVVPTYNGETPTKAATAQYTYTFNGWSPALYAADKAQTYTATYTGTPVNYTLAWVTDGDELTGDYTAGTIAYGTTITAPNTPTKDGYAFNGWDANNDGTADEVAETMPTTSLTYKAIWVAELPNITLCENCDNDHYNTFKSDYDR